MGIARQPSSGLESGHAPNVWAESRAVVDVLRQQILAPDVGMEHI